MLSYTKISAAPDPFDVAFVFIKRAGKNVSAGIVCHKIQGIKIRLRVKYRLDRFYTRVANRPGRKPGITVRVVGGIYFKIFVREAFFPIAVFLQGKTQRILYGRVCL